MNQKNDKPKPKKRELWNGIDKVYMLFLIGQRKLGSFKKEKYILLIFPLGPFCLKFKKIQKFNEIYFRKVK